MTGNTPQPSLDESTVRRVAAPLETIASRGYFERDVFADWIELMLTALCGQEDAYLETVQSYPNDRDRGEREADLFSEAFGQLQQAMAATDRDVLGDVYEYLGIQNTENGQHFTPHSVCELKARLVVDGDAETVRDPACGSGRLLIAAAKQAPEAVFVGRDNDRLCAKMAALNMCFFNLDAVVIYGDSLKLSRRRAWQTANTPLGGAIREVDPDDADIAALDEAPFRDDADPEEESGDVTGAREDGESPALTVEETRQVELGEIEG